MDFNFSFYVVGFVLAIGALFGRLICGWLCPSGLIQELIHKIPSEKNISYCLRYFTRPKDGSISYTAYMTTHRMCKRLPISTKMWKTECIHFFLLPMPYSTAPTV